MTTESQGCNHTNGKVEIPGLPNQLACPVCTYESRTFTSGHIGAYIAKHGRIIGDIWAYLRDH